MSNTHFMQTDVGRFHLGSDPGSIMVTSWARAGFDDFGECPGQR